MKSKEENKEIMNKLDGSPAYKVIDADSMTLLRIFHEERRHEMLDYYSEKYKSVSEDADQDIICSNDSDEEDS